MSVGRSFVAQLQLEHRAQPLTYCGLQGHARTWWVDHPFTHHASVPDLALLSGPHFAVQHTISILDLSSHTCAEL